jgi:4-aminobutyrate aminotransferase-like enzyme
MALASIEALENGEWGKRVEELGRLTRTELGQLARTQPGWGAVRGLGLLTGVEVRDEAGGPDGARAGRLIEAMLRRGFILLSGGTAGQVLTISPPFVIEAEELRTAIRVLGEENARELGF